MILFLLCSNVILFSLPLKKAIESNYIDSEHLFPSKSDRNLYEIELIKFEGNNVFSYNQLYNIISSRPTRKNTFHKVINYYYSELRNMKMNKSYLPKGLMVSLKNALYQWSNEIQYFKEARAESDMNTILNFYNQNGFHDTKVFYSFMPDLDLHKNVLTYYINEQSQYSIGKINIYGLDSIDNKLKNKIHKLTNVKTGDYFNEDQIVNEITLIQNVLRNNGYYYSKLITPIVSKDTVAKKDSITILFETGKRQKISNIVFIDNVSNQKQVSKNTKYAQLTFKEGQWYSKREVDRSRNNLQSLGIFELVNISPNKELMGKNDTLLPLQIFTKYRKLKEWGAGLFINKTTFDAYNNAGIEASYQHRNVFGAAQSFNIFTRIESQNISRLFSSDPNIKSEWEYQFGFNYAQPLLWAINKAKVGLAIHPLYSYSKINSYMQFKTFSIQLRFPTELYKWTFFNKMSFDFLLEWQRPVNYYDAINSAVADTNISDAERTQIKETFKIYQTLNDFYSVSSNSYKPTALIFGFSITGDTRDNLFSPTKGYYANFSYDSWFGLGIAKFLRPQFSYNYFKSLNKSTVFALKAKIGYIYWWDRDNSYIPIDKQFFAGGANSVRGWESRRLRYNTVAMRNGNSQYALDFAKDFIGSRMIAEGSFEFRWRFGRPNWTSDIVADAISMGVMTGFIDWGNTFHWIAYNDDIYYNNMTLQDYLSGVAVSAGLGIGIMTPVGPFRVDYSIPIYDPTPKDNLNKFVFLRSNFLSYYHIHFGLGYAF